MLPSFLNYPYTTPLGLDKLHHFAPDSEDHSILRRLLLRPIWMWSLNQFVPNSVAPNLITFSGFIFIFTSYILTSVFSPSFIGDMPTWVNIFNGLALLIYQTMDNWDGGQARKTNTSSPLGHLFDHGVDTLVTLLVSLVSLSSLSAGVGLSGFFFILFTLNLFWMATWEEKITGKMVLGVINGPNEGIILTAGIHFLSAAFGNTFWTNPSIFFGITYLSLLFSFVFVSGFFTLMGNLKNILPMVGLTNESLGSILGYRMFNMHIVNFSSLLLYSFSSTIWFSSNFRLIVLCFGFLFVFSNWNLILSIVCDTEFYWNDKRFLFLSLFPCVSLLLIILDTPFSTPQDGRYTFTPLELLAELNLWILFGFELFFCSHFCINVSRDFCVELGIQLFRITPTYSPLNNSGPSMNHLTMSSSNSNDQNISLVV